VSPQRRRRDLSVRARLTLATAGVVAIALALGALVLVWILRITLLGQHDAAARDQARGVADLVTAGRLPEVVPSGGTTIVQVLDAAGRVAAASAGGDRLVPLLEPGDLARARAGTAVELSGRRLGISEVLRVVGVRAGPDEGQTVLVAGPVADVQRSVAVVEKAMVVVCVVLVAGAAVLSRWLVGSALRPVETLTRDAAALGTRGGAGTLPLPAADDEIRRLAVTLNGMLGRLDAAAKRQRAFVADAAHELRSPLASIRTAVEVSRLTPAGRAAGGDGCHQNGAGENGWRETADDVLEDTARMSRLVDDLLLLARLDGARETPEAGTRTGDLAAAADRVVERLERQHRRAGRVTREGSGSIPVRAGEDVLERVVVNLVENAARFARTRVEVTVRRSGGDVLLTVTDDGPGVPSADRERVFERFTRLDDARSRDEGGSGLGLAIVRELVRAHGGDVHLEDAAPGLRAVVRLPAGQSAAAGPA
jgi:signal transduction histidine kinase